jgi:hypothetical protein
MKKTITLFVSKDGRRNATSKVAMNDEKGLHDRPGQTEGTSGMQETNQGEIIVCGLIRELSEPDVERGGSVQDDSVKEIPGHRHDNKYILHGYRINFNTVGRILRSLFMIHKETVNVWSHLIGVLFFIGLIVNTALWWAHSCKCLKRR